MAFVTWIQQGWGLLCGGVTTASTAVGNSLNIFGVGLKDGVGKLLGM